MGYAALLIVLSAMAILLATSCGRTRDAPEDEKPRVVDTVDTASATRADVRERLRMLAKEAPPTNLSMGAMCYEMAAPPARIDYVCPTCGEKTLYAVREQADGARLYRNMAFLQWDLPACRRLLEQIDGVQLQLDESQFCAHCTPDVERPVLVLVVSYGGQSSPHRVGGVTLDDMQLLHEFFSGQNKHTGEQGRETPLKNHTARLSELLGVQLNADE